MTVKRKPGRPDVRGLVGYVDRPVHQSCSSCAHYASDFVYPGWAKTDEQRAEFDARGHAKTETKIRCAKHGFTVRRLAICKTWEAKT